MRERGPSRRGVAAIVAAIAVWGIGAQVVAGDSEYGDDLLLTVSDLLVGWTFAATGLVAWHRRPQSRTGPLMIAVAFAWFLRSLYLTDIAVLFTIAVAFGGLVNWVLVHLALGFPSGRLERRSDRALVLAVYGIGAGLGILGALTWSPEEGSAYGASGDAGHNLLLVDASIDWPQTVGLASGVLLNLLVIAALARRWRSAAPPERRVLAPFLLIALFAAGVFLLATIIPPLVYDEVPPGGGRGAILAGNLAIGLMPLGFLAGLLRTRVTRSTLGTLMEALAHTPGPAELRDHMAAALGDPSMRLGYWAAELGRYVEADGRPFEVTQPARFVEGREGPLAVIVHDRFLLDDEGLVEATTAAARLALENARLQAEVNAQLAEVRASRARIVAAGDSERRRLERDLHDGAQQRLVALALALKTVRANPGDPRNEALLAQAESEAAAAVAELRELARGIHPQILSDEGLVGALESLAERCSARVALSVDLPSRPAAAAEAAAYFVCAEAVTNALKHADASEVRIVAAENGSGMLLEISDDGKGGVRMSDHGGLRGIADRVEALGGTLEVDSPEGVGTTLRARIPTGGEAVADKG